MPPSDLERIFALLEGSGARYLVVDGVAVVLHGQPRFSADLDRALAGTEIDLFGEDPLPFEKTKRRAERLRWLEQAKRFASRALDAARKRKGRPHGAGPH